MSPNPESTEAEEKPLVPIDTFGEVRTVLVRFRASKLAGPEVKQNLEWISGLKADLDGLGDDVAKRRQEYLDRYGAEAVERALKVAPALSNMALRVRNSLISKDLRPD